MKAIKKILGSIFVGTVLFIILGCTFSSTMRNMLRYTFADIEDYKIFPNRPLSQSANPFHYPKASLKIDINKIFPEANGDFSKYIHQHHSVSFLIIHNDSIQFEKYFNNYDTASIVPSFSMAKSITSLLIGCAIEDSIIKNVQEPITNYIPELKENGFEKVSIEHVLQMTTGLAFNESYWNPLGEAAQFYYGTDITKATTHLRLKNDPGKSFDYTSGNTQLLGLVLQRALKTKTVTQYLNEKIWQPLQMEYDASWSLDNEKGMEKTFCCINARARDFAKIGTLMLHKGNWHGKQIIPQAWVEACTKANEANGGANFYKYQWWLPSANGDFEAKGILGQYIYVNPIKNLVIVRQGTSREGVEWDDVFMRIAEMY